MLQIPQEILDHILDYLHDDSRTLGSCALASRTLLQTSRYHRFSGRRYGRYGLQRFAPLLLASPDLAHSIRSLTLLPPPHGTLTHETLSILQHLHALADLSIHVHALPDAAYVPQLTSLHLGALYAVGPQELLRAISSFPSLKQLELVEILLDSEEDEVYQVDPPTPTLQKLRFRGGDCAATVCEWFSAHGTTPPYHSFTHTIRGPDSAANFKRQSDMLSGLVQELEVRFIPDGRLEVALRESDAIVASYDALHSCAFRFAFGEMCVPENSSLQWIPQILAQLPSSSLRSITISLAVDNVEDLRSLSSECAVRKLSPAYFDDMRVLDWPAIENALLNERLHGLKKVVVEGLRSPVQLEAHIQKTCPELFHRGCLAFVTVEDTVPWLY